MKKFIVSVIIAAFAFEGAAAWSTLGHETVVAIAQRHISKKTKENISKWFDYNLQKDARWMDTHRNDPDIAYTTAWHTYSVDSRHRYDPNPRLKKGDAIYAMQIADYNLRHYQELTDSAVVMNIRMLIHFAGDMHCPVHCYFEGIKTSGKRYLNGEEITSFHTLYDHMPEYLWPGMKPDDLAELLDDCGPAKRRRITRGTILDWVHATADRCAPIYDINAPSTKELAPDTVEKSRELVSLQLRDAGYRLAYLLDKYFGK